MYASKPTQALIGGGVLAQTGYSITNSLFWGLTAVMVIIVGVTLFWLFRTRPAQMTTGPKPVKARPRYRRKT